VKVCMGIHRKTGNRCWFVDKAFNPIGGFEYILGVKPMDRIEFQQIVNLIKVDKVAKLTSNVVYTEMSYNKLTLLSKADMATLDIVGLVAPNTRNNACVNLAIYYNSIGLSEREALIRLDEWIDRQDTAYYKTPLKACHAQNKKVISWAYRNKIIHTSKECKNVMIRLSEIEVIRKVVDKKSRILLFAMLCHAKRYGVKTGDNFFMTYTQFRFHTGILKHKSIKNTLYNLSELGLVSIIKDGEYSVDDKRFETNIYAINFDIAYSGRIGYKVLDYTISYTNNTPLLKELIL
jgi:hypothetical protein